MGRLLCLVKSFYPAFEAWLSPLIDGGLLAFERSSLNVVLDKLIVPINTRRHDGVIMDPLDQFFLGVKAAPVDELPRDDRIQDESRRRVRVQAAKQILNVVALVLFSQPHA